MPGGRPKAWDINRRFLVLVAGLAKEGKTNAEIAEILNISESTLYKYKAESKEFSEALNEGAEVIDSMVEESLLSRALGYTHDEVKLAQKDGVFTDERVIKRHYPPDITAMIFWLKNRKPGEWRDRVEESDGDIPTIPRPDTLPKRA